MAIFNQQRQELEKQNQLRDMATQKFEMGYQEYKNPIVAGFVPALHTVAAEVPAVEKFVTTPSNVAANVPSWNVPVKFGVGAVDSAINAVKGMVFGNPADTKKKLELNKKAFQNIPFTPEEHEFAYNAAMQSGQNIAGMTGNITGNPMYSTYNVAKGADADFISYQDMLKNDPNNPLIKVIKQKYPNDVRFNPPARYDSLKGLESDFKAYTQASPKDKPLYKGALERDYIKRVEEVGQVKGASTIDMSKYDSKVIKGIKLLREGAAEYDYRSGFVKRPIGSVKVNVVKLPKEAAEYLMAEGVIK